MAARTKTKVSPKYKTKYRVKNWPAYDIALSLDYSQKKVVPCTSVWNVLS